ATGSLAGTGKQSLWGAEANLWKNLFYNTPGTVFSFNVMGGFRYLDLNFDIELERNSIFNSNLTGFPAFLPLAGATIQQSELFATRNQFYGAQAGVGGKLYLDRVELDANVRLALGTTHEEIHIAGSQLLTRPDGSSVLSQAGVLAVGSNIGRFH